MVSGCGCLWPVLPVASRLSAQEAWKVELAIPLRRRFLGGEKVVESYDCTTIYHMVRYCPSVWRIGVALLLQLSLAQPVAATAISANRVWEVLPDPDVAGERESLRIAGERLGKWTIVIGDLPLNGTALQELAAESPPETLLRAVRERLRQPVDLYDFLLFLDDLLVAGANGLRGFPVVLPSGRARNAGILLHPQDVFRDDRPRMYGTRGGPFDVEKPQRPADLPPAVDGDLLGPNWTARFRSPEDEPELIALLVKTNPLGTYHARLQILFEQLRAQGADVCLTSTVRSRRRGYLMWGAFYLSNANNELHLQRRIARLVRVNRAWGLHVPIRWRHPDGWQATMEAARSMKEAYDVVYATQRGARRSDHYDGAAVDFMATALPRRLELQAPDGATAEFDLSHAEQARDLNLTPELIAWVEEHFEFTKLRGDYPHWTDAGATAQAREMALR